MKKVKNHVEILCGAHKKQVLRLKEYLKKINESLEQGYLIWIDILGFSSTLSNLNHAAYIYYLLTTTLENILDDFSSAVPSIYTFIKVRMVNIGDGYIITIANRNKEHEELKRLFLQYFTKRLLLLQLFLLVGHFGLLELEEDFFQYLNEVKLQQPILLKGAITSGEFSISNNPSRLIEGIQVFGTGIQEVVELEKDALAPLIHISSKVQNDLDETINNFLIEVESKSNKPLNALNFIKLAKDNTELLEDIRKIIQAKLICGSSKTIKAKYTFLAKALNQVICETILNHKILPIELR